MLAIVNNAAVNTGVYVVFSYGFLRVYVHWISGSHGSFLPSFFFCFFFKESP